jgi:DNA repair exonuclease SbcCD ATPase subunit
MNKKNYWIIQPQKQLLIGLTAAILFLSSLTFGQNAVAQGWVSRYKSPQNSSSATTIVEEQPKTSTPAPEISNNTKDLPPSESSASSPSSSVTQETTSPFAKTLSKTQLSFEKALSQANQAIADLPQQIEQVSDETILPADRKRLKNLLEDKQDGIEEVADKIDDLAEKLESFNSKLQKSIQQNKATVTNEFQQNAQNAQISLEDVAKKLNNLADDVERAKKNSTPAFRSLIGEEITSVNQTLEAATKAIKTFVENPA